MTEEAHAVSASGAPGTVPTCWLADVVASVFGALGFSPRAAGLVAETLVAADMRGVASHGVMLVPMYVQRVRAGSVSLREQAELVRDYGAVAGHALGALTGEQAMRLAVGKARRYGVGLVSVRRAFHFGGRSGTCSWPPPTAASASRRPTPARSCRRPAARRRWWVTTRSRWACRARARGVKGVYADMSTPDDCAHLFVAIEVAAFEAARYARALRDGVALQPSVLSQLRATAAALGVRVDAPERPRSSSSPTAPAIRQRRQRGAGGQGRPEPSETGNRATGGPA